MESKDSYRLNYWHLQAQFYNIYFFSRNLEEWSEYDLNLKVLK